MSDGRRESFEAYLRTLECDEISRRSFLKLLGASIALAGIEGCTRMPAEKILPYVNQPEFTPGVASHYATAMVLDGYASGVLVESHDGRPTKIEGNPDHPASLGAAGIFEQASLLQLYAPHRAKRVRRGNATSTWRAFTTDMVPASLRRRVGPDGERLRLLMEPTSSPLEADLLQKFSQLYPAAGVHFYTPLGAQPGAEPFRAGSRALVHQYDFQKADVILSVGADFLARGPFHLRYARQFAERRRPESAPGGMNRLYAIEASLTVTGAAADHRLAVRPSEIDDLLEELLALVANPDGAQPSARIPSGDARSIFLHALARDLAEHRGRSVVIGGLPLSRRAHSFIHAINGSLANVNETVWFTESPLIGAGDAQHSIATLVEALTGGVVDTLVCLGGNPAYATPGSLELAQLIRSVPQSVYVGLFENETARVCGWMIPAAHYLESWGDARAYDGTISILQPLIAPLYEGRTTSEVLAALIGETDASGYDLLRASSIAKGISETSWRDALGRGVVPATEYARSAAPAVASSQQSSINAATLKTDAIEIEFSGDARAHDGSFSDNPWLQELPDPITTLTWGNAAHLSSALAAQLGVESGDMISIKSGKHSTILPALVVPGHADNVISVHFGYGRQSSDSVADGVGVNVYPLWPADGGFVVTGAEVRREDGRAALAVTQSHWALGPEPPARSQTLGESQRATKPTPTRELSLYQPPTPTPSAMAEQQWAMTIDLSACIGCTIACQAENNIPVVGKDDVLKSREMHWLRIDRYLSEGSDITESPVHVSQPMLCQHCEKAPCEYVCPVEATVHSPDGLNEMVYNRCIGTRFCSNNCPYKVRRFNWFDYNAHIAETEAMAKNPDVTVRERGVMEKCTFCVQRIRGAEINASAEGRELRTDEVRTACQQACPTNAIVFGSLTDERSAVLRGRDGPRAYDALGELGTQPRVKYLARVRNPNPKLEKGP